MRLRWATGTKAIAVQTRCHCGTVLPGPVVCACGRRHGGRARQYCSEACRRTADHLQRKIRRREAWIVAWTHAADFGGYSRAQVRLQLKTFTAELRTLRRAIGR